MSGNPIMIVSLRIAPEKEAEFNEFYHHRYIPKLLEVVPEIRVARRYEEYGVAGSLKWFTKRFLVGCMPPLHKRGQGTGSFPHHL